MVIRTVRRLGKTLSQQLSDAAAWCRPALPFGQYAVLSTRPMVLLTKDFAVIHPRAAFLDLLRRLAPRPVQVYYVPSWAIHEEELPRRLRLIRRLERTGPRVRVTVLGTTEEMTALFASAGVDTIWCNQNAFADERIFRPMAGVPRRFRAIYDARLEPFKRHELAAEVNALALMGYRNPGTANDPHAASVIARFAGAHWFFDPRTSPDQWQMTDADVNLAYNQCAVGLCLSAVEGAMWASIQYLLAGLPVVSTPSRGGRDVFFEAPQARIVDPTPRAVAEGVAAQLALGLDPTMIRDRTLALMAPHRTRFVAHVQACFAAAGETRPFAAEWRRVIRHRMTDVRMMGWDRQDAIAAYNDAIVAAAAAGDPYPEALAPMVQPATAGMP